MEVASSVQPLYLKELIGISGEGELPSAPTKLPSFASLIDPRPPVSPAILPRWYIDLLSLIGSGPDERVQVSATSCLAANCCTGHGRKKGHRGEAEANS